MTAFGASTPSRSSAAWKIVGCGFTRPCERESTIASTSSRWCATNSCQVADAVRDEADAQPRAAQLLEHRQHVLEELEVLGHAPALLDLRRALVCDRLGPAHADEDLLGEAMPDRLVVQQLRMALEVEDGRLARLVVPRRVEGDAVARRRCAHSARQTSSGPGRQSVKSTSKRTARTTIKRPPAASARSR